MHTRREFLKGLFVFAALAPELIPRGREFISLYTPQIHRLTEAEIVDLELKRVLEKLPMLFDRDSVFYELISGESSSWMKVDQKPSRIPMTIPSLPQDEEPLITQLMQTFAL